MGLAALGNCSDGGVLACNAYATKNVVRRRLGPVPTGGLDGSGGTAGVPRPSPPCRPHPHAKDARWQVGPTERWPTSQPHGGAARPSDMHRRIASRPTPRARPPTERPRPLS